MKQELRLYRVLADVETDQDFYERYVYIVLANSAKQAEQILHAHFFGEHPHDLCKRGKAHVGVDRVKTGRTKRIASSGPQVLGGWLDQDEFA